MDRKRISRVEKSIAIPAKQVPRKRLDDQMRSIFTHVGTVKNADGSGYIEAENIKIICAVYKKQQKDLVGQLVCDFKFAPFSTPARRGYHKDDQERDFSTQLEQALVPSIRFELYEFTRIEVHCLVLESDGLNASLAHGITCASLALCHANIELFDLVTGSSGGHLVKAMVDLAEKEEEGVESNFVLAMMPHLNEITLVLQTGKSHLDQSVKVALV
jgi:exosome complex component MTR3